MTNPNDTMTTAPITPPLFMAQMGRKHRSGGELDSLSSSERDVLLDALLYSMDHTQRAKVSTSYPGIWSRLFPSNKVTS